MQLPLTDLTEQTHTPTQAPCASRSNNTTLSFSSTEKLYIFVLLAKYKQMQKKVQLYDEFLNRTDLLTTTMVAKDAGFSSAQSLNKKLEEKGILINQNKQWHPSAEYNWLITEDYCAYDLYSNEKAEPRLKWTSKGMLWMKANQNNEEKWKRLPT